MIHSHWKVAGDSNITLLLRSNPSLEQVLEQPDLLPELRVNTELQTFGVKHQVLAGAVLSSGIGCVVDAVFSDDTIALFMLKQLTSTEKRLAGLTLDLLCKVLSSLLIPVQSREFTLVKSTNGFLDGLIRYLESYSVCDYIIALLKLDVFHQNSGSIQWFCEHGFITMLLNVFLEENISLEKVESVSRIINEIVIWRHSHQIGAAANIFVDFFNVDKNLEKFIQCVFSTDLKDVQEHGLLIISDMLACNTSRSELCTMPINGLPAIYKNLVIHFSSIKELLTHSNSNIGVGQTRIKLGFIVLSLLLSSYSVIYKLVDEHAFINALLDIFYDERHQCTIFRQIVLNIMNTIMQRPVAEIKGKILQDNTFLERTVKLDKDAIAYYKQNNIYPDYFLINATMMNDIYNNKELKTTTTEITINNETFLNYVQNIIIPRNSEESKYFSKTHVPDNYFDNNTYTNFLLNAKQLIDDDDMF